MIPAHVVTDLLLCINSGGMPTIVCYLTMKTCSIHTHMLKCNAAKVFAVVDKRCLFEVKKRLHICFNKMKQRTANNLAAKQNA